jgi:hypothetical protein
MIREALHGCIVLLFKVTKLTEAVLGWIAGATGREGVASDRSLALREVDLGLGVAAK